MTDKLTAKFSDGSEFEVVNEMLNGAVPGLRTFILMPIKREPREGWMVINDDLDFVGDYTDEEGARAELERKSEYPGYRIIKVREVVE